MQGMNHCFMSVPKSISINFLNDNIWLLVLQFKDTPRHGGRSNKSDKYCSQVSIICKLVSCISCFSRHIVNSVAVKGAFLILDKLISFTMKVYFKGLTVTHYHRNVLRYYPQCWKEDVSTNTYIKRNKYDIF